jgi:phage gpG-like protein
MSKKSVTFTFKPNDLANIEMHIHKGDMQREFQRVIETEIKPSIARGISPVRGKRNFAKYKNPARYPGDQKQSNKPNLELTGEMLKEYVARESDGISVTIGIHGDAPEDVLVRANANQNGTVNKNGEVAIAARPFMIKDGEEFNSKISIAIRKAFVSVITKALKSMKGR